MRLLRAPLWCAIGWATGVSLPNCDPNSVIYEKVIPSTLRPYIRNGKPETCRLDEDVHLPRACRERWSGKPSCCTEQFFREVGDRAHDEATRMANVRYIYLVLETSNEGEAACSKTLQMSPCGGNTIWNTVDGDDKYDQILRNYQKHGVARHIGKYIDECEDAIRLYFAAPLCELCNPRLHDNVRGDYMEVQYRSCKQLHAKCKYAPDMLDESAGHVRDAARELELLGHFDQGGHVSKTHKWLKAAELALTWASQRVRWYSDSTKFCGRLRDWGFQYESAEWGDLDMLHPAAALNDRGDLKVAEETDPKDPMVADLKLDCVHGWGPKCICDACWRGLLCDEPAPPGALDPQLFHALVAGRQATLAVYGCAFPTMAWDHEVYRIKLVDATSETVAEGEECKQVYDKKGGHFADVKLSVPTFVTERSLEYEIDVPANAEGVYAVCHCVGVNCADDEAFRKLGDVEVVRSDADKTEKDDQKRVAWMDHTKRVYSPPSCNWDFLKTHWFPRPSIKVLKDGNKAHFQCAPGFVNIQYQGNPIDGILCDKGVLYEIPQSQNQRTRQEWNNRLPHCDCEFPEKCSEPPPPISPYGEVTHLNCIARYQCPLGRVLRIAGEIGPIFSGEPREWIGKRVERGNRILKIRAVQVFAGTRNKYKFYGENGEGWVDEREITKYYPSFETRHFSIKCQQGRWPDIKPRCETAQRTSARKGESILQEESIDETANSIEEVLEDTLQKVSGAPADLNAEGLEQADSDPMMSSFLEVGSATPADDAPSDSRTAAPNKTAAGNPARESLEVARSAGEAEAGTPPLSFLELGSETQAAETQPAETLVPQAPVGEAEGKGSAADSVTQAATGVVGLEVLTNSSRLHVQKWPVRFTDERHRGFEVDTCWFTWNCSHGLVPSDSAAAQDFSRYAVRKDVMHSPFVMLGVAGLVFLLATFCAMSGGRCNCRCRCCCTSSKSKASELDDLCAPPQGAHGARTKGKTSSTSSRLGRAGSDRRAPAERRPPGVVFRPAELRPGELDVMAGTAG